MAERPVWSISRAAAECGVSRDTIKRRRAAGEFPNAQQNPQGQWLIPVTDLLAAGLHPGKPSLPPGTAPGQPENAPGAHPTREAELENQLRLLQFQLDAERHLREATQLNAEDLRRSLRMLESAVQASQPAREVSPEPTPTLQNPPAKRKRRFMPWGVHQGQD